MGRVNEKEVTVGNRTFRLRKFDPETGCYWGLKLFGSMASGFGDVGDLSNKVSEFIKMPKKEFREFQQDCLRHVFEMLPAGPAPVINPQGQAMVVDWDQTLAFELMIHSFMFSISDFFTPELLDRMMGAILGVLPNQETPTENSNESTDYSLPPSVSGTGNNTIYGTAHTP